MTKFEKFLINRNLMERFGYNLKHHRSNPVLFDLEKCYYTFPYSMIQGAFHWAVTPDGYDFWYNVNQEWRKCLNSNTLL